MSEVYTKVNITLDQSTQLSDHPDGKTIMFEERVRVGGRKVSKTFKLRIPAGSLSAYTNSIR